MKISLLCIGKTQSAEIKKLIEDLEKRIPRYLDFNIRELPEVKNAKNLSVKELQWLEMIALEKEVQPGDVMVLLDEKGKEYTSEELAAFFQKEMNRSTKHLVFVVGGALGFHPEMFQKYPNKIALSRLTFTHQMVRLFFVEQLYRAYSIVEGKPYHNS